MEYAIQNNRFVQLGSGRYGSVFLGRLVSLDKIVALKFFKSDEGSVLDILHEASIMQYCNQTNNTPHCFGIAVSHHISM